jgi:hypothetical protein
MLTIIQILAINIYTMVYCGAVTLRGALVSRRKLIKNSVRFCFHQISQLLDPSTTDLSLNIIYILLECKYLIVS